MKSTKLLSIVGAVIGGTLLVAACDGGDQRPLNYKKGVYLGKPHTPLNEQTLEGLRARAAYQAGPATVAGGGEHVSTRTVAGDVRPPATNDVDMGALRQRAGYQSGAVVGGGGGGATGARGVDANALRQRAGRQRQ